MRAPKLDGISSPAFVIDLDALQANAEVLASVAERSGARVLMALKAFAAHATFDVLRPHLFGTCASGAIEARLGREEFGGAVHTYAPAYTEEELAECLSLSDHVVFNSFGQWERFGAAAREFAGSSGRPIAFGFRINPEHSEVTTALYDPCRPGSRLGIRYAEFEARGYTSSLPPGISGLHFHTLCELGADALARTLDAVEARFGALLPQLEWVNFGGGHHITRPGYDVDQLVSLIRRFSERYGVQVYLEPGEAVALDAGVLLASVLDIVDGPRPVAILDVSATAHMPDVLEMPYRPKIEGAFEPNEKPYSYELGGPTCLAGDVIGAYSFERPLQVGQRLVFYDMAIYTMVKTTFFNGVHHPDIVVAASGRPPQVVRRFGYSDYKARLS